MWGFLSGILDSLWSAIGNPIVQAFRGLASGVSGAADDAWNLIKGLVNEAISALSSLLDKLHDAVSAAWGFLSTAFGDLERAIDTLLDAIWTALSWTIKVAIPDLYRLAKNALDAIGNLTSSIVDFVQSQIDGIAHRITDAINAVTQWVNDNVAAPLWAAVKDVASGFNDLYNFVHGLFDDLEKFADSLVEPLALSILRNWKSLADKVGAAVLQFILQSLVSAEEASADIVNAFIETL